MSGGVFVLHKQRDVISSLTDAGNLLGLRQTSSLLQDCVTEFLGCLACDGVRLKQQYNRGWVFTRSLTRYTRRPCWNEVIDVKTAIARATPLLCEIDTEVRGTDGEPLLCGRLELCTMDLATRRPCSLSFLPQIAQNCAETPLLDARFHRGPIRPTQKTALLQTVCGQDTDMNGHCNNVALVRMLLNALDTNALLAQNPSAFEINFEHECREGQTLALLRQQTENTLQLLLRDSESDTNIASAILYA